MLTTADHFRDCVSELLDLAQQRRFERVDGGEHLIDAAELRLGAGSDNDADRAARDDQGAGERHIFPIPDRRIFRRGVRRLVGRHRLARQGGLVGP